MEVSCATASSCRCCWCMLCLLAVPACKAGAAAGVCCILYMLLPLGLLRALAGHSTCFAWVPVSQALAGSCTFPACAGGAAALAWRAASPLGPTAAHALLRCMAQALYGSEHQRAAVAEAAAADTLIRRDVLKVIVPELTDAYKMDISYTAG
jgi:hypothetical protein